MNWGGVWTPMSKPNRKLYGTSEKLLKGVIALSKFSHSSGTNGVLMIRRSGDGATDLGIVPSGAAEGARMFSLATGGLCATGRTIPGETISFPGSTGPCAVGFLSDEMTWGPVRVTGGDACIRGV